MKMFVLVFVVLNIYLLAILISLFLKGKKEQIFNDVIDIVVLASLIFFLTINFKLEEGIMVMYRIMYVISLSETIIYLKRLFMSRHGTVAGFFSTAIFFLGALLSKGVLKKIFFTVAIIFTIMNISVLLKEKFCNKK